MKKLLNFLLSSLLVMLALIILIIGCFVELCAASVTGAREWSSRTVKGVINADR